MRIELALYILFDHNGKKIVINSYRCHTQKKLHTVVEIEQHATE